MMKRFARVVFCAVVVLPIVASAGENEWTYVGLYPQIVQDILVRPNNPDVLYAAASDYWFTPILEGGIFKTTDHGLTWDTLGFQDYLVNDLAFDPQHPETLWAACGMLTGGEVELAGAFRSTDGGNTWERRSAGLFLGGPDGIGVTSIAVSPFDGNLLMCTGADPAGWGWLARTTNGGELWTEVGYPDAAHGKVLFDSLCPGRVFATAYGTLAVSEDSGLTFRYLFEGPCLPDFELDPFRRDWIWGIERESFLYSPDAGSTWIEPDTTFPPEPELGLFVRVSSDRVNTIYATGFGAVFQTQDGGLTWLELYEGWPTQHSSIEGISIVAGGPDELWAGLRDYGILSYTVVDTSSVTESSGTKPVGFGLQIWPNPATSILHISMTPQALSGIFSLYNILGQRVFSIPLSQFDGEQILPLPDALPCGTYFGIFTPARSSLSLSIKANRVVVVK